MKTYVLFTFAIYGIGGTQIYARNKMLYMQKLGWKTCMVTTEPGVEIMVKEMESYKEGVFPELMRNPFLYTTWKRKRIVKKVVNYIFKFARNSDEIVIESNFIAITPWAELVAKKIHIKNFIFLIQEDYNIKSKKYLDFFYFKYKRGELAVNTTKALSILFKDVDGFQDRDDKFLVAYCSNVIEDCGSILPDNLLCADYNIGSIGRINKPFVLTMIKQLVKYITCHPSRRFNLVIFGGSPDQQDIETIKDLTSNVKNLHVHITGPIFPIPLEDIKRMNVCISSAGAATTSANAGVLTIAIDAIDFKPIGIVKCTTNNIIHRDNSENADLFQLLDDILIEKKYDGILSEQFEDYSTFFDKHIKLLLNSAKDKCYYDVCHLAPNLFSRFLYMVFGAKLYSTCVRLKSYIKAKKLKNDF